MKRAVFACLFCMPLLAYSATLKKESFVCLTEEKYDQLIRAISTDDMRGAKYLMGNGCILTNRAVEVSILDQTWSGGVKLRMYTEQGTAEVWTNIESVNR